MIELFLLLVGCHLIADFALQDTFVAVNKARGGPNKAPWWYVLFAHAGIHGTLVGLVTGYWFIGLAEAACHWITDHIKCEGLIGFKTDQFIHIVCKVIWTVFAVQLGIWWF